MAKRVSPRPFGEELAYLRKEIELKSFFNKNKGKRQRVKITKSSISIPQDEVRGKRTKKNDYKKVDILEAQVDRLLDNVKYPKYRIYNK